jgi:hypothetical protein
VAGVKPASDNLGPGWLLVLRVVIREGLPTRYTSTKESPPGSARSDVAGDTAPASLVCI